MNRERSATKTTVQRYFETIRSLPALSREEELAVARRLRDGSEEAARRLVEANLRFVTGIALEYRSMGLPLEDLLNEGSMGLIEAARHFDPDRGIKFITYAVWWIRRALLQALEKQVRLVRLSAWQSRKTREVTAARRALQAELGRRPTLDELARHLDTSRAKVEQWLLQLRNEVSLDQPPREDGERPLSETLPDQDGTRFESAVSTRQMTEKMSNNLRRLTPTQQRILHMRFGLDGRRPMTLRAVGAAIGLTGERVRQIEAEAMDRMRQMLTTVEES